MYYLRQILTHTAAEETPQECTNELRETGPIKIAEAEPETNREQVSTSTETHRQSQSARTA
eukprot:m.175578 g.175578  ORF g.175578 m.175578 type:complete len:61 (+) comp53322_c0_seq1:9-191(+)